MNDSSFFRRFGKQFITVLILVFLTMLNISFPLLADQPNFSFQSKSTLLMEAATGEIIFENNADEKLPPASITKIMTLLLIMEALDSGRAHLDDIVRTSENAMRMGGSQIYLEVGEEMTLNDLVKSIAIASANDSCVAVAEYLAGTEADFIKRMNQRAQELGMKNTYFTNTTGLPPEHGQEGNYTTARDIAIMSKELLKHPEILDWTSIWMDTVRNGQFGLTNTNRLVRHYAGVDGLKTGYTSKAKFCLSATGTRNNLRFIAVVLQAPTSDVRFKEISTMLSYGFNSFTAQKVVNKDQVVKKARVSRGKVEEVALVAKYAFNVPLKKGATAEVKSEVVLKDKIIAPIAAGEVLGELVVFKGDVEIGRVPLLAKEAVKRGSIFQIIFQILKNIFMSLINIFR